MQVRATQKGYYGVVLREPGQVFKLRPYTVDVAVDEKDKSGKVIGSKIVKREVSCEEQFTDVWMEKVSDDRPVKGNRGSEKQQPIGNRPEAEDEEELAKRIAAADRMSEEARKEDFNVI